ncbi:MAG: zinc ribbon domain-containing protein [Candidatus Peribacteraceae bacterium]|nr:zinc ribbon domain-containing protein [Candidatus Peribacteraceae bacterium]
MNAALDYLINFDPTDWMAISLRGVFAYLFVVLVAIVIWVARDVVSRSKNLIFQVFAILLVIVLNLPGLLIYLIIRPQKTLAEKYHETLEHKVLAESEEMCPKCDRPLPLIFQFCPNCGEEARKHCKKCHKLVSKNWSICPYCGTKKSTQKKLESDKEEKK